MMILNSYTIPFKKLEWKDNTTDLGKDSGYIYLVGEFFVNKKDRSPITKYFISNSYAGSGTEIGKIMVFSNDGNEIGNFDNIESAKIFCQENFEQFIVKTFFEK